MKDIILSILLLSYIVIATFHTLSLPLLLKYKKVLNNWDYLKYLRTDEHNNHFFILSKNGINLCTIRLYNNGDFHINDLTNNELYMRPLGYLYWEYRIRKKLIQKLPENLQSTKIKGLNFTKYL